MSAPPVESLDSLADAQILERLREIERTRRQLEIQEAALLGQVRSRSLAFVNGCKNDVDFLRHLLTISVRDAASRVKLAAPAGRSKPCSPTSRKSTTRTRCAATPKRSRSRWTRTARSATPTCATEPAMSRSSGVRTGPGSRP